MTMSTGDTMFLTDFYQQQDAAVIVSAEQASAFAKDIAGDFNPIHNPDHKRFCVPGDLLFALTLGKYGLSKSMAFTFEGMVGKDVNLQFPEHHGATFHLQDDNEKQYLTANIDGECLHDEAKIEAFIRSYVAFSGLNFMHVLVPLMTEHQVMINTARPLVIYESMSFELEHFDFSEPELILQSSELAVEGKRGDVTLMFDIMSAGKCVGHGRKTLILSGLRAFEQSKMEELIGQYESYKEVA